MLILVQQNMPHQIKKIFLVSVLLRHLLNEGHPWGHELEHLE